MNRFKLKNKLLDRKMLLQEQVSLKYRDSVRCQKLNAKLTQLSYLLRVVDASAFKMHQLFNRHMYGCDTCRVNFKPSGFCSEGKRLLDLCQSRSTF